MIMKSQKNDRKFNDEITIEEDSNKNESITPSSIHELDTYSYKLVEK